MKTKKLLSLLLVLVLVVAAFAGCAQKTTNVEEQPAQQTEQSKNEEQNKPEEKPAEPKVFKYYYPSDIPSLDPSIATDQASFEVLGNTIEGLFALTGNNEVKNGVAESYTVSEDGLTYTFKLRKDSVWSNGDPVTAHDFVYSWKRLANPETGAQYAFMIETAGLKNGSAVIKGEKPVDELGVRAEDDYTLVAELEIPVPYFINLMTFPSFYPINQKFAEEKGDKFGKSIEATLFNGPYVLSSWETEYEYVLSKNDKYWDKDNVDIDEIRFRIIKDPNTAVNMYETGELDRVGLVGEQIDEYADHPDLKAIPGTAVFYLQLNQKNEILKNVNARRAFALAIDKTFITDEILKNGSKPADYLVPSNLATGPDGKDFRATTGTYNSYNKEKAAEYWAKAKKELGIDKAEIDFLTYDSETSRRISEYIQGQLQANLEGLTVNIVQQPFKNKLALEDEGQFDFSFAGWGPDYGDPMTFLDMWITESGHNVVSYNNEEYDNIIKRTKMGDLTTDLETRWKELQRAEKILLEDDVVLVPLYQKGVKVLQKPYIKNMNVNAFAPDYYYKSIKIVK